jgi:hypothetical protein
VRLSKARAVTTLVNDLINKEKINKNKSNNKGGISDKF